MSFLKSTANDVDTIARVAIDEQLKSWRRIPWADNALARLANASNRDIAELIFAWPRLLKVANQEEPRHHRYPACPKPSAHILYLVRGIGERAEELASFIAHWRQLDRIGPVRQKPGSNGWMTHAWARSGNCTRT